MKKSKFINNDDLMLNKNNIKNKLRSFASVGIMDKLILR